MFKRNPKTNFLIENKFQQSILHMVLKAGYYNKIAVHGDEAGEVNVKTLEALFGDDAPIVQVCEKIPRFFWWAKICFFCKGKPEGKCSQLIFFTILSYYCCFPTNATQLLFKSRGN